MKAESVGFGLRRQFRKEAPMAPSGRDCVITSGVVAYSDEFGH